MCVSVFCAQHLLLERLATASITITPLSYYIYIKYKLDITRPKVHQGLKGEEPRLINLGTRGCDDRFSTPETNLIHKHHHHKNLRVPQFI